MAGQIRACRKFWSYTEACKRRDAKDTDEARIAELRKEAPDLAVLFDEEQMPLSEAYTAFNPDSPDEMAFGQLLAPISMAESVPYAGSSSRILADPTGERRNRQFRQRFCGLRSCRPDPPGESGFKQRMADAEAKKDATERKERRWAATTNLIEAVMLLDRDPRVHT